MSIDREQIRRDAEHHATFVGDGPAAQAMARRCLALLDELERADQHMADRAKVTALIDALVLTRRALLRHAQWCGYRPEAPGDPVFNDAMRASEKALSPWEAE